MLKTGKERVDKAFGDQKQKDMTARSGSRDPRKTKQVQFATPHAKVDPKITSNPVID